MFCKISTPCFYAFLCLPTRIVYLFIDIQGEFCSSSQYGVKLYTYGWKMMDQDILEIEYVNVEDFDAARKAASLF